MGSESLPLVLQASGFILSATFLIYVTLIVVPYLRHRPSRRGVADHFDYHFLIPCLNEAPVIERTVRQALDGHASAHVWCIDDASSDQTRAVIRGLAAECDRVHLVARELPDAQQGKGAALNAGWRAIRETVSTVGRDRIIVGVLDADGRLEPGCLDVIASSDYFGNPRIGAVQVRVQIRTGGHACTRSRARRLLVTLQDVEFSGPIAAMQLLRRYLGSVGMGGNGQFTRLSILDKVADDYGEPWHGSLLEDFELGLHVLLVGFQTAYCHDTSVGQEGLSSVSALLRQRCRWAQGLMQCRHYLVPVLRSREIAFGAALEIAYFLLLPWIQIIGSALFTVAIISLGWLILSNGPGPLLRWMADYPAALMFVAVGLMPLFIWGPLYRRFASVTRWEAIKIGLANWPYTYLHQAATWWAFARIVRSRDDWKKTRRELT